MKLVASRLEQELSPEQYRAVVHPGGPLLVLAGAGSGKCLGRGTPVIRYDGTVVPVQEVAVGDLLMGPDSQPRRVLSTCVGHGPLFQITPVKGDPWVCNDVHVMTLAGTNRRKGEIIDVPLRDYLERTTPTPTGRIDKQWKLLRVGIDFPEQAPLHFDPYLLGLWIGNGSTLDPTIWTTEPEVLSYLNAGEPVSGSVVVVQDGRGDSLKRVSYRSEQNVAQDSRRFPNLVRRFLVKECCDPGGRKRIPHAYLTASREQRLQLLAGILDTDGYLDRGSFEIVCKHRSLADQVLFLCRSLGFAAYVSEKPVQLTGWAEPRIYWRIGLSGDFSIVPCKVNRRQADPRRQVKRVNVTGWSAEPIGEGAYFGFELDGDGRFLLGDFTVTHNTRTLVYRTAWHLCDGVKPDEILVSTFTNRATNEFKERLHKLIGNDADRLWMGTLHAIGSRILRDHGTDLGYRPGLWVADVKKSYGILYKACRSCNISKEQVSMSITYERITKWKETLIGPEAAHRELENQTYVSFEDETIVRLYAAYQRLLREANGVDFGDLVMQSVMLLKQNRMIRERLRRRKILVDEFQDTAPAQWAMLQLLMDPVTRDATFVGDIDQCQPPGTLVTVARRCGNRYHQAVTEAVPIEELQVGDRVVSYNVADRAFVQGGRSVRAISSREYSGDLVVVETEQGHRTRYTPSHRCLANFSPLRGKHAVYLMSKDNRFRIGKAQLGYNNCPGAGPYRRMLHEGADRVWILAIYETDIEARVMEAAIGRRFGIPQLCFRPCGGVNSTKMPLDQAWEFIGDNYNRGVECLAAFGRDIRFPLVAVDQGTKRRAFSLKRPGIVHACNLLEKCLMLPYRGRSQTERAEWVPISVSREHYTGKVYSLDVEAERLYVADGLVTHNCIYRFRGADPRIMKSFKANFPDGTIISLGQNYRSTQTIVAAAASVIANNVDRIKHRLYSRRPAGVPIVVRPCQDDVAEAERVMQLVRELNGPEYEIPYREIAVLFRTNHQSQPIEDRLLSAKIPYHVVGHRFFDRQEIKDVLCFLRVLHAPDDPLALEEALARPRRRLPEEAWKRLQLERRATGENAWQALIGCRGLEKRNVAKVMAFLTLLTRLTERMDCQTLTDLYDHLVVETGIKEHWEKKDTQQAGATGTSPTANLERLRKILDTQFNGPALEVLPEFLEYASIMSQDDPGSDADAVQLMTIHHCVHPNTLVETPEGMLRIKDIPHAGQIATPDGVRRYRGKFVRGCGRALRITTKAGYCLTVSPDHGMTTWDQGHIRREAEALVPGDLVRLKLGATCDPDEVPALPTRPVSDVRAVQYQIPDVLTEELAEFLGLMVADGTIYPSGFRLTKSHPSVLARFSELIRSLFGASPRTVVPRNTPTVEVNSTLLASWLLQIDGLAPHQKDVPDMILRAPLRIQAAFLRGLFEDGTVNLTSSGKFDHIHWENKSEEVAATVQMMLLRFGIIATRRTRKNEARSATHGDRITTLYLYSRSAALFRERIGFIADWKNARLYGDLGTELHLTIPFSSDEAQLLKPYLNKSAGANCRQRGRLSRETVWQLTEKTEGPLLALLQDRLSWFYDRIDSIEEVECETMCVEVPEGNRFLQNGFDGWNSKGTEFQVVLLVGAEERLIPHGRALNDPEDPDAALEEERRLFYVGMTRAKDILQILYCKNRANSQGRSFQCRPSRFLLEVPGSLTVVVTPEG